MIPVIALVGRPNVGKSTLMNRILGRREAIVEEKPGVTRDRKEVEADWRGRSFLLIDTGGWLPSGSELDDKVSRQSERAMDEANVVLFVVDAAVGITEEFVSGDTTPHYHLASDTHETVSLSYLRSTIVLGNATIVFQRGILLFTDGMAWLGQIVMFIVLGLLSTPSEIVSVVGPGLLIGTVLIFVARPAAVFLLLLPFGYRLRELVFLSWVGLKGSVPIILATYPLLLGVPEAATIFNVVFFVVLLSALTQGWSLPLVARRLGLARPPEPEPAVTLEITSLRHVDGDFVEYNVSSDSRAANRRVRDLGLPEGAVLSMIARDQRLVPPRGSTVVLPGDYVFLVMRPGVRPLVNRVFGPGGAIEDAEERIEFPLAPQTTVGELEDYYGIHLECAPSLTVAELIENSVAPERPNRGTNLSLGAIILRVREMDDDGIAAVDLEIPVVVLARAGGGEMAMAQPAGGESAISGGDG